MTVEIAASPQAGRHGATGDRQVMQAPRRCLAVWLLASCSALYFTITSLLASRPLLSHDEVYTLYGSSQPTLGAVWAFLKTGLDQSAPLFFMITRAALNAFGESALVLRLPAMLGFALMSLCLFCLVARRTDMFYGTVAMLVPLTTRVYDPYAWQARPYGLVLGFASLALVAWEWTAEGRRRPMALVALTASLAAAISTHYYAVLLLVPLGLGEAMRTWQRRRVDACVWTALGLSLAPLVAFVPLMIAGARRSGAPYWARPSAKAVYDSYVALLPPYSLRATLGLGILFTLGLTVRLLRRQSVIDPVAMRQAYTRSLTALARPHVVAILGYTALPVLAYALGRGVTGAYAPRYALFAIIGIAVLYAYAAHWLFRGSAPGAAAVALFLCVVFAVDVVHAFRAVDGYSAHQAETYTFLKRYRLSDTWIVVPREVHFLPFQHSAPDDLRKHLMYLADSQAAALVALSQWAPLNVEEYASFLARRQPFLVYAVGGGWLVPALRRDGVCLTVHAQDDAGRVLLLARPGVPGSQGCTDNSR